MFNLTISANQRPCTPVRSCLPSSASYVSVQLMGTRKHSQVHSHVKVVLNSRSPPFGLNLTKRGARQCSLIFFSSYVPAAWTELRHYRDLAVQILVAPTLFRLEYLLSPKIISIVLQHSGYRASVVEEIGRTSSDFPRKCSQIFDISSNK